MVVVVGRKKPTSKLSPEQYAVEEAHTQALALTEEQYQNFDVVWAKLGSYPWWPAVLFYSWEAVNAAGLELKTVQQQLVIPPPKVIELGDGRGKKVVHFVLIMFLDKFNCNIIEISPKCICPFSINYDHLVKGKAKSGFKVALARAMRLLHMDENMTVDELIEIAAIRVQPSPQEYYELAERSHSVKKQKRPNPKKPAVVQLVEETEDEYVEIPDEDEVEDDDDGSDYSETKKRSRGTANKTSKQPKSKHASKASQHPMSSTFSAKKAPPPSRPKRPNSGVRYVEAIDDDEDENTDDFEVMSTDGKASAKATSSRKKASRKEGRNHRDVIMVDDEDGDSHEDFIVQVTSHVKGSSKLPSKAKSLKSSKVKPSVKVPKETKKVTVKPKPKKGKSAKPPQPDSDALTDYDDEPVQQVQPKKSKKSTKRAEHAPISPGMIAPSTMEPAQPLTLTPLSAIWTTRVSTQDGGDTSAPSERLAYKLDLLWDNTTFTDPQPTIDAINVDDVSSTNARGGMKRQGRSVQQSQIRQSLLTGNLDPHTMVQCEPYLPRGGRHLTTSSNRSRGPSPQLEAPYEVVVHPDVVFVCDLHAHLATCEIIGFLGGRWDDASKTLYIQAAFPCRSLVIDGDDGSTDVEMDPGSEIELREIIQNAELEVVGWYHSHPAFAPDPSVRDIENQGNYQQLFQRRKQTSEGRWEVAEPFVGLIVGTYDSRRDSPVGLFRYFHVRGERVSSSSSREISMPYELVPRKRAYRSVTADENRARWRRLPLYTSVATMMFGANVLFYKAPQIPSDEISLRKRSNSIKGTHDVIVHSNEKKKRKLSSGELGPVDNGKQRGNKKPRSRRPKSADSAAPPMKMPVASVSMVDKSGVKHEVIDLMSDPSQTEVDTIEKVANVKTQEDGHNNDSAVSDGVQKNIHEKMSADASHALVPDTATVGLLLKPESSTRNKHDQVGGAMRDGDGRRYEDVKVAEEIIAQSQDSLQDAAHPVFKNPAATNHLQHFSTSNEDETVGPSSSSSQSEHSFNYDASQSQSLSTQEESQVDESMTHNSPRQTSYADSDDPYAGIEVIEPKVSTSFVAVNTAPHVLEAVAVHDSHPARAEVDEFVGDSAHDSTVHSDYSVNPRDESAAVASDEAIRTNDNQPVDQESPPRPSPVDDESGSNSAVSGGGSTPIDSTVLPTGRRRNRKPSTTIRHVDTSGSFVQWAVASPHSTTSAFAPPDSSQPDDASSTNAVPVPEGELGFEVNEERRRGSEEMIWDDVEVIVDDYQVDMMDNKPVPNNLDLPLSNDVSMLSSVENEVVAIMKTAVNQNASLTPVPATKTADPANPVDAKVDGENNAIADIVVVSQTSDGDEVTQNNGQHSAQLGVQPAAQAPAAGGSEVCNLVTEPLEVCHLKVLRVVASRLKLRISPEDRNKDGLIQAIRAYWKESGMHSQRPNSEVLDQADAKVDGIPIDDVTSHKLKLDRDAVKASVSEMKHSTVKGQETTIQAKSPDETRALEDRSSVKPHDQEPRSNVAGEVPSHASQVKRDDATALKNEPTSTSLEPNIADEKPLKHEPESELVKDTTARNLDATTNKSAVVPLARHEKVELSPNLTFEEQKDLHLRALRTNYGDGIYGCAEQVITLIDYYRDFDRRTDLHDVWKGKITKLQKLEASLLADVMQVNVPVALRESFVKDVIGYLRTSWSLSNAALW